MTTILGLRADGVSYLAADSRSSVSECVMPTMTRKIVEAGSWRIAFSGGTRVRQVVEAARDEIGRETTAHGMATAIRAKLLEDGFGKTSDPGSAAFGPLGILLANESGVWHVGNDFSHAELEEGRPWGQGSGGSHAEGAASALLQHGTDPAIALAEAIQIASRFDPGTDDRVQIVRLGGVTEIDSSVIGCPVCRWPLGHALDCSRWMHENRLVSSVTFRDKVSSLKPDLEIDSVKEEPLIAAEIAKRDAEAQARVKAFTGDNPLGE